MNAPAASQELFPANSTIIGEDEETPVSVIEEGETAEVVEKPVQPAQPAKDDDDEELASYSEKVQKRINKLTYQHNEERRQREAAERMREEAIRVAQQLAQKSQQYEEVIKKGEAYLIEQIKGRAALAAEKATEQYRTAYEAGDTNNIVASQRAIAQAEAELREASKYDMDYQNRMAQAQQQAMWQQQQPQPQYQPVVPKPTEKAVQWAQDNPWFSDPKHKDMTALAYGIHETLVRDEGIRPDTDEYYQRIDSTIRSRFPEYFDRQTSRNPSTVVAPAGRNNGAKPRQVKLNQTQIALAKRLGITLEQYAKELIKGNQNG